MLFHGWTNTEVTIPERNIAEPVTMVDPYTGRIFTGRMVISAAPSAVSRPMARPSGGMDSRVRSPPVEMSTVPANAMMSPAISRLRGRRCALTQV